jgi:hypothetical protein
MGGAQIHGLAAVFDQAPQQAGFDRVGVEAVQPILVLGENLQDLAGVQRVVLVPLDLKASRYLATVVGWIG